MSTGGYLDLITFGITLTFGIIKGELHIFLVMHLLRGSFTFTCVLYLKSSSPLFEKNPFKHTHLHSLSFISFDDELILYFSFQGPNLKNIVKKGNF